MVKLRRGTFLAALLFGLVAIALCAVFTGPPSYTMWATVASLLIAGTTVTYVYPVSGTVAPTAIQAAAANAFTAQVFMADGETTVAVTHNWQVSAADLAKLFPVPIAYVSSPGTAVPIVSVALTNSVAVTINKVSAAGSGGTFNVVLFRPHSMMQ